MRLLPAIALALLIAAVVDAVLILLTVLDLPSILG